MKIYTRGGDTGETGLFGGARVPKEHARVEAYGTVDELAAALGWARAAGLPSSLDPILARLLDASFRLGAELACRPGAESKLGVALVDADDIAWAEQTIDLLEAELPPLKSFVLPGGSPAGAALHVARTVCRRAERRVLAVRHESAIRPEVVVYLNRIGDLCFVLARRANQLAGFADVPWNARGGAVG